jgi:putative transposase
MPYSRLFYHVVWGTKHRLPLITDANRDVIFAAIRSKTDELHGIVHALNAMPDHVHLAVSVPPALALSHFVGQVKGLSSHLTNQRSPDVLAWQSEYGVLSISESHLPVVVRYVVDQQKHHAENTLDARLERWNNE